MFTFDIRSLDLSLSNQLGYLCRSEVSGLDSSCWRVAGFVSIPRNVVALDDLWSSVSRLRWSMVSMARV